MASLELNNLSKSYDGNDSEAVAQVSLSVDEGELLVIVGESGSGKSTLLRLIAGLEYPDNGEIVLGGKLSSSAQSFTPPEERKIGFVFQDYALFPHLSVADNVAFGIKERGNSRKGKVDQYLRLVGLEDHSNQFPHQLSGGEQQRVAMARALATNPHLILMDEPFSNLDEPNKDQLRREVKDLLKQTQKTALLVTHDVEDAFILGDRIAVMQSGKLLQVGDPKTLYYHPVSKYVAGLFGKSNLISGHIEDSYFISTNNNLTLPISGSEFGQTLCLRPECLEICAETESEWLGTLIDIQFVGDHFQLSLQIGSENNIELLIINSNRADLEIGKRYGWKLISNKYHIIDGNT